jgi:IclR family acetate operon transcriptional repressor
MSDETSSSGGLAVNRALSVLTYLADSPAGAAMKTVHVDLQIPFTTLHRLLGTLEAGGWVVRSPTTRRYRLGPAAARLGRANDTGSTIVAPPAPLRDVAASTGETVFLTRLFDTRVICVSLVEAVHPLRLFVRAGQEMPLHAAASARSILAFQEAEFVEHLLTATPRDAFTPATLREVNRVIDHLVDVRRAGFDVCDSELDNDVWAVAAPVFRADGRVEAALTMAAAAARVDSPEARAAAAAAVLKGAHELSRRDGYRGVLRDVPGADQLISEMEGRA